jgi:hypothetical protein
MGGQSGQPVQGGEDLGDLRSLSNGRCYPIRGTCVVYVKPNLPQLNPIWGIYITVSFGSHRSALRAGWLGQLVILGMTPTATIQLTQQ